MSDLAGALRRYADSGDPIDLDAVVRRPRRRPPFLRAAAAIVVGVAAIAAVITLVGDDDDPTRVTTTPPVRGLPSSFVALSEDGTLQVRNAPDGAVQRTLASIDRSGPATLAVAPDGTSVYVARKDSRRCTEVVRVDLSSGDIEPIGPGSDPAISLDGRRLAYVRQNSEGCTGIDVPGLVIRDLATGLERTIAPGPEVGRILGVPSWAPGGADIAFRVENPSGTPPVVLAVDHASTLQDARRVDMDDGHGWFGYLGDTGQILGLYLRGGVDPTPTGLVTLDAITGEETGRLVATDDRVPSGAVSDRTGRHVVYVADDHAYRWSVGEDEPVALGDAIAVAWIPSETGVVPTLTTSAPLVRGTKVHVRVTGLERLRGNAVELAAWTPGPIDTFSGGRRVGYGGLGELTVDERGSAEGDVLVPNALSGEDDVIPLEPGRTYSVEVTLAGGYGPDRVRVPIQIDAAEPGRAYAVTAGRGAVECGAPPLEVDIDGGLWVPTSQENFPAGRQQFEGSFTIESSSEAMFVAADGTASAFTPGEAWHC
jgi:hypothetical protein